MFRIGAKMDDYSVKTIQLYIQDQYKPYLVTVLRRYWDDVPDNITESDAIRILRDIMQQKIPSAKVHKSSRYKCPKCSSTYVTVREVQLRSADEGSSIMGHCNKCGETFVY